MNRQELEVLVEKACDKMRELHADKGNDYASDEDVLINFKNAARDLGITPEQIWGVYAGKHWSAIMTYCKDGQVESEPIGSRILDLMTYCTLLLAMVSESRAATATTPQPGTGDPVAV